MQWDIGLPDPKRPRHILPSTQQGLPIQRMNVQVNDRKSAAPRVTPDARITRGELELVKALLRGPSPYPTLLYAQLRNAGQKAGSSLSSSS